MNQAVLMMYNIARRTGQLPKMPKELTGNALQVKYISILTQAQRMMKLQAIQETLGFFAQNAQVFPQMMQNIDQDNIARGYMEDIGLPASYFTELAVMKKNRDAQAKANAQAAQLAQKEQMGSAMQKGGAGIKSMADAKMGEGGALDALLGGMSGGNKQQ
jgi:hypothetical protein